MKKPRPFTALLTVLLGIRRFGFIPLLLWFALSTAVLYVMTVYSPAFLPLLNTHIFQTKQDFFGSQLSAGCALYFFLMVPSTPIMLEFASGMRAGGLLEFLFTRALDRGIFLRAERVAQAIVLIVPLLLNLAISPFAPELDFGSEEMPIRHAPSLFAGWLTWAGILCIYLVAGYHVFAAKRIQKLALRHSETKRGLWLVLMAAYAPLVGVLVVIATCAAMRINLFQESFSFFVRHLAISMLGLLTLVSVVQPLSERGIRKLQFF